ncbi:E3 ubiquitin-protein ligase rnf8 [Aplysia californica]|uniref:E3 ubiquitin-protein ligase CHFR n=1 Tax=Aplysia californica TaxID=6500 RepID=A0ABM0K244_APLCA|nr:E3 ubiquitin-protein ligase rnf8 [Aplysia californica]
MTEIVPCLLRIGDNVKKYKLFKLNREQVTIGRSGEVTYAILSNMISRCHAMVKQQEDSSWTITDNKSLNGIYINGRRLAPMQPHLLHDGDMVQFGIPVSPDAPAEFIYKFYSSLKVRTEKKAKKQKCDPDVDSQRATLSASESFERDEEREKKRKSALLKPPDEAKQDSANKELRQQMEVSQQEQAAKEAEYQAKLAEMERLLMEKEKKQEEVQQQLEQERKEKENQAKEVEELRMKEAAILMEMEDKQKQLEKEKEELRLKMQAELESNLREREAALLGQLAVQKEVLLNEKKQVEESLQKEVEKAIEEKNKELEEQLMEQKQKLEKVLEKKEMEQKLLESQLNETKEESETAKLQALKAREEVLCNFVDLMEMELQCSICNELYIKATSLNCSHSFCKLCINQWLKVKKECPNCRQAVTSQMQSITLDSYIDKMVEQLNDELKQRRKELVAQRKVEQDKFDGLAAGPSAPLANPAVAVAAFVPAPPRGRGRGSRARGRATTRSQRGRRITGAAAAVVERLQALQGQRPGAVVTTTATVTATGTERLQALLAQRPGAATTATATATGAERLQALQAQRTGAATMATGAERLQSILAQRLGATMATATATTATAAVVTSATALASVTTATASLSGVASTTTASTASSSTAAASTSGGPDIIEVSDEDLAGLGRTAVGFQTSEPIDVDSDDSNNSHDSDDSNNSNDSEYYRLRMRARGRYRRGYSSSDEYGDSDSVEGAPDAYYGGYGRCHNCGARGHWANGCPQ